MVVVGLFLDVLEVGGKLVMVGFLVVVIVGGGLIVCVVVGLFNIGVVDCLGVGC